MIADAEEGFFSIDDLRDLLDGLMQIQIARPTPKNRLRDSGSRGKASRGSSRKRKASPWNVFVKTEMPKVLKAHPRFTPQRAMKEVAARWRRSSKNPNRRR